MEESLNNITVSQDGVVRGTTVMGKGGRLVATGLPFPDGTVVHALVTLLGKPESMTDDEDQASSES